MRLFIGIALPQYVRQNLESLLGVLRPAAEIHWSPPENLHLTTKFIGPWSPERLDELTGALKNVPGRPPCNVEIRCLGWFPNPHAPRVFWAGVHGGESLKELARDTEQALAGIGVPLEKKAYSPHLTLARIDQSTALAQPPALAALRQAVANLPSREFGMFPVDRFMLYRSVVGSHGSRYSVLAEFPL